MALEAFVPKAFRRESLRLIDTANDIIAEYQARGFTLTLRQLYYQFVSRDKIENKQSEYKRLGSIINDGRLAGLIDWSAIEDRTRNVATPSTWDSPQDIVDAVAHQYKENPWADQKYAPEVWIEKDALVGVIEPVCKEMRVPYFACRGYASQSEVYSAGKRFLNSFELGKTPIVFHLGDHDPSGLDMTRDITDRLAMFAEAPVKVVRLALNMSQIEQYRPPPNPAKDTDARFEDYAREYGESSWELDALDPTVINDLIQNALDGIISKPRWKRSLREEAERRADLKTAARRWDEVVEFING